MPAKAPHTIETNGAAGVDSVALRDLINGKAEIGSVKRRRTIGRAYVS